MDRIDEIRKALKENLLFGKMTTDDDDDIHWVENTAAVAEKLATLKLKRVLRNYDLMGPLETLEPKLSGNKEQDTEMIAQEILKYADGEN